MKNKPHLYIFKTKELRIIGIDFGIDFDLNNLIHFIYAIGKST